MNAKAYKSATSKIFWGVIGNTIFGIFGIVFRIMALVAIVAAAAGESSPWYIFLIVAFMELFGIIILVGFGQLIKLFSGTTRQALKRVRIGIILEMIADLCLVIPILGPMVATVISIIWAIIYIGAFGTLSRASDFPGRDGANFLRLSMILALVAFCIQFIPFLGVIGSILEIVISILILVGWWKLKSAPVSSFETSSSRSSVDDDFLPSSSSNSSSSSSGGYHSDDF